MIVGRRTPSTYNVSCRTGDVTTEEPKVVYITCHTSSLCQGQLVLPYYNDSFRAWLVKMLVTMPHRHRLSSACQSGRPSLPAQHIEKCAQKRLTLEENALVFANSDDLKDKSSTEETTALPAREQCQVGYSISI